MNKFIASILLVAIATLLVIYSDFLPQKGVTIWVFDVGQGDAIFIDAPHKQMLIDGGGDERVLERLAAVIPWWDRSIDIVVNTHPHADHLAGLVPVLERYKVAQVLDADEGYTTPEFAEYLKLAGPHRGILAGDVTIDLGDGVRLKTLWPELAYNDAVLEDPNDGSIVFLLEHGQTSMLLTGDAGISEEAEWEVGDIDILKVGHHGSDTSTSQELVDRTLPEVAIISLGEDNDYGHPSSFVVDRLMGAGAAVYRTDEHGSIRIATDGIEYHVTARVF
jgi:beta-lactamase superfamily II metal-dependent hydrolase